MSDDKLDQKVVRESGEGTYLDPVKIISKHKLKINHLKKLIGQSIISAKQFDIHLVRELCTLASYMEGKDIASYHPLDGKIIVTAFFEASTRTRLSFESSAMRLGAKVLSIPDGQVTGAAKGESLQDMGEMLNAYGDMVILRHTETDSVNQMMENLRVPLISAGHGSGEHPTQALADWYALLKWKPELYQSRVKVEDKIHIGIIGTPGNMRAVKSFLLMGLLFKSFISKISVISEMADPFGDIANDVKGSEIDIEVVHDLEAVIENLDVIYMNSIAFLGDSYKKLDRRFKLNSQSRLKKDAVILHPFARSDEIDRSLDSTAHNLYFAQASGAVYVREALLTSIFNRFHQLPEDIVEL